MPSSLTNHGEWEEPLYFEDLLLLESWSDLNCKDPVPSRRYLSVSDMEALQAKSQRDPEMKKLLELVQDPYGDEIDPNRPFLMVTHDFQGGYNETPQKRCYTFEHWQLADFFVYFSHKTISPPPPDWVDAAHRAGTKILGTIIFEWKEAIPGLAQLLRGPDDGYIPLSSGSEGNDLFSPFYADILITLALEHGLDGWLVNIELPLELGFQCSAEQWPTSIRSNVRDRERKRNARRLRAWVTYLRLVGAQRVAVHNAQVDAGIRPGPKRSWHISWYDSVTYPDGQLRWQDALTKLNQPFFNSADSLFTNYTWAAPTMKNPMPGAYPQQVPSPSFTDPATGGTHPALKCSLRVLGQSRSRNRIFTGIDVFGRNCYGGHETYKSLNMIMPHRSQDRMEDSPAGLSVALFAPGWTWEHDEPGRDGRGWQAWWEEDMRFWRGHSSSHYQSSSPSQPAATPSPSSWAPLAFYFPPRPIPVNLDQGFYTSFARGSGTKWTVRGHKVLEKSNHHTPVKGAAGYTAVGTTMPQPTALWPQARQGSSSPMTEKYEVDVQEDDEIVWAGNLSLRLTVHHGFGANSFIPLVELRSRAGKSSDTSAKLVCVAKVHKGASVAPTLDNREVTESKRTTLRAGWERFEGIVDLSPVIPGTSRLGLRITSNDHDQVTVGAVALVPVHADLDVLRSFEVDKDGVLRWDDFAPWTPFYEILTTHPDDGTNTWLGTATFECGARRTEYQLPRLWAGRSIQVQPLV